MDQVTCVPFVDLIARKSSSMLPGQNTAQECKVCEETIETYGVGLTRSKLVQRYDLAVLSKDQLLVLMRFSNAIMSQSLPVKCVFMTLKALKTNLAAELVEICYPDKDSTDWIIHSVGKDGILHKKTVPYPSEGAYHHAFSTGTMLRIDDCEGHVMYNTQCDKHGEIEPRNLLLYPLIDSKRLVWGVSAIVNCPLPGDISLGCHERYTARTPLSPVTSTCQPSDATTNPSRSSSALSLGEGYPVVNQNDNIIINGVVPHMDKTYLKGVRDNSEDHDTTPSSHDEKVVWDDSALTLAFQICDIGGQCISNAIGWRELEATREKANGLLTLMHSLFADRLGIQSCVVALTTHARKLIQAERCTVYIVDNMHEQLWSISSDDGSQVVVSLRHGCASECVSTGESIVIDNTCEDPRFTPEFDSRDGVEIRNVAWVPIKSGDCSRVLAVIEVINKQAEELLHFGEDDLRLLEIFAAVVGPQLEKSDFAISVSKPAETEAGLAFKTMPQSIGSTARQHIAEPCIPEIEDE